jgi:Mrp family chromosome partitioning ATPase
MSRNYKPITEFEKQQEQMESSHLSSSVPGTSNGVVLARAANEDANEGEIEHFVRRVFVSPPEAPRTVLFCGVDTANSSGSICARAGCALARISQGRVCLVDANTPSRMLSNFFEEATQPKVVSVKATIFEQCRQVGDNLWLAGGNAGNVRQKALPPREELEHFLLQLRVAFDYVLIDVPSARVGDVAQVFGSIADGAILVVDANQTRRLSARNAQQILVGAGVHLLGAILYNRTFPIPEALYKRL